MDKSIKDSFTEQEWFLIASAPSLIGASMASAGKSGFVGTIKEAMTSMKTILSGKNEYPDNEIIACILQGSENFSEAKEQASHYRKKVMEEIERKQVKSNEDFQNLMLENCGKAIKLVETKCTEIESAQYNKWVKNIAEKVAESASEGGFLGFGGEQVSENERLLLNKIDGLLNTSHA